MIGKLKGAIQYAAKAVVAAVGPVVIELVDRLVIEMGSVVQTAVSAFLMAILVYFVPNNYDALS